MGIQNLNIDICNEAHCLFSADEGWMVVQEEKKEKSRGILSKHHVYIDKCTSYVSTPYPELLENMRKHVACWTQKHWVIWNGHSQRNRSHQADVAEQRWGCHHHPPQVLEKIWPITYNSRRFSGLFVIHTNQDNIIVKNNSKGMPYLDLASWRLKLRYLLCKRQCRLSKR